MPIILAGLAVIFTTCKKADNPEYVSGSCFGHLVGGVNEIFSLPRLGSEWVRPHPGPFSWQWIEPEKGMFDWDSTDKWVKAAQKSNISILGTIWPYADWDQLSCHSSSCEVSLDDEFHPESFAFPKLSQKYFYIPKYRCVPCNFDDYKNFLTKLVERYDGDGTDDMPGLTKPVLYWEILNEPEMDSKTLTFFKGSKEEYVQILQASYEAIKAACPDCMVLHGGAAGINHTTLEYWEDIFDLGGGNYFDIANIHFIGSWDAATLNVKDFKALLDKKGINKPIWITEAQFPSKSEVVSCITGAMDAGASKIFAVDYTDFSSILNNDPSICGDK